MKLLFVVLFILPMNANALTKYQNFEQIIEIANFCAQKGNFKFVNDENNFGSASGLKAADLNLIMLRDFDNTLLSELKKQKFPFGYLPSEKTENGFEEFMKSNGLVKAAEATAHEFSDISTFEYKENKNITIKKVITESDLKDFAKVAQAAFAIPQEDAFKFLVKTLGDPQMQLFLALIDGKVAGSSMLFINKEIAEMAWDGVFPDYRKKGVASAMLGYRMNIAKEIGAKIAVSQNFSTSSGYYKRLGFKPIGEPVPVYVFGDH